MRTTRLCEATGLGVLLIIVFGDLGVAEDPLPATPRRTLPVSKTTIIRIKLHHLTSILPHTKGATKSRRSERIATSRPSERSELIIDNSKRDKTPNNHNRIRKSKSTPKSSLDTYHQILESPARARPSPRNQTKATAQQKVTERSKTS